MVDIREQVIEWLKSGREDAADIVNLPWEVKQVEENLYIAEHPKMPFTLILRFTPDFVILEAPTTLETAELPEETKVALYDTLLELNNAVYMMKFTLIEPNKTVATRADLSLSALGKDEFNDALTAMTVGLLAGVMAIGVEEEFMKNVLARIIETLREKIRKGYTYEQLMEFLTERVGISAADAKQVLDEVLKSMSDEFERS
ncbi:DNA-binding protein [Thermococcus sp.]|uniref:DNA-binding protein n=1 Tax=Thermococcus sp. TaxID=35749 RepID=UPI00262E0B29|nr:DNA-binding protein [Thermococcus sp.]